MLNFFDNIPSEIILEIISYLSAKELKKIPYINKKFYELSNNENYPLYKFRATCREIESNPNYQPHITNKELLNLVMDENGKARYTIMERALAILPSLIHTALGKLYQIKIAQEGCLDDEEYISVWHVDDGVVMLVKYDGSTACYLKRDVENNDFSKPLERLKLTDLLHFKCLHNQGVIRLSPA